MRLHKTATWYNPFSFVYKNKQYEIMDIIIYKTDGTEYRIGHGWFGAGNNETNSIEIPNNFVRRCKPKFDGQHFFVRKDGRFTNNKNTVVLYMPFEYWNFNFNTRIEKQGIHIIRYNVYTSEVNPDVHFMSKVREDVDGDKEKKLEQLKEWEQELNKELEKVKEQIRELIV